MLIDRIKLTGLAALVAGATASLFAAGQQTAQVPRPNDNGVVRDTAKQERIYSLRLDSQTLSFELKDKKIVNSDWSDEHHTFNGAADEVRESYLYSIARGIIPDVRHLYPEVREIAQLMFRDTNYLADPDNGFEFLDTGYWTPKNIKAVQETTDGGVDGLPLAYAKRNIFIGGLYYDFTISLMGEQINEKSFKIKDLFEIKIYPSAKGNEGARIDYGLEIRPGQNYERYMERRSLSTGKRMIIETMLSADGARNPNKNESIVYVLDLGGIIQPLTDAVKKQVVYFDKNWNPIKQ